MGGAETITLPLRQFNLNLKNHGFMKLWFYLFTFYRNIQNRGVDSETSALTAANKGQYNLMTAFLNNVLLFLEELSLFVCAKHIKKKIKYFIITGWMQFCIALGF